jgi:nuclear pore complex protein Nup133
MDAPSIRQIRQSSFRQPSRSVSRGLGGSRSVSIVQEPAKHVEEPISGDLSVDDATIVYSSGGLRTELSKIGVVDLTKNAKYCVSRLPAALPVLRKPRNPDDEMDNEYDEDEVVEGMADQTTHYALVSTMSGSFVWNYNSSEYVPSTISFPASEGGTKAVLVAPAPGSKEPGMVSVAIETGHVSYWESVVGAVADGLLTSNECVSLNMQLYSNEVVEQLQAIEPAGVVITTSIGRFMLVNLRDNYGKTDLKAVSMLGGGLGLLSSIKSALIPASSRRGIKSVKAGAVFGRMERQVMFVNNEGDLSIWRCALGGRYKLLFDGKLRELLLNRISGLYNEAARTFTFHDVELYEEENCIFLLTSFSHSDEETFYVLYTIELQEGTKDILVRSVHRVQTFTELSKEPPRLVFPKPRNTLFLVFSKAIVLLDSLPLQSGDHQLGGRRWEDIISFRYDIEVVGASPEDLMVANSKIVRHCGIVVVAKVAGIIRIERFPDVLRSGAPRESELEPEMMKSKIEQAVFYGSNVDQNPVVFDARPEVIYDDAVVDQGFLQVSKEILENRSVYIAKLLTSQYDHLSQRVHYLSQLAKFLHSNYVRTVSVGIKFELLWDLEKAAAARALWSHIDPKLQQGSVDSVVINVITDTMSGSTPDAGASIDLLRHWFSYEVSVMMSDCRFILD